jgi:hypothetical protein
VSATLLAAFAAATAGAGAPVSFRPCPNVQLRVRTTTPGTPLPISQLGVSHLSCAEAEKAVRSGSFELTPANPIFSTPGFRCTSPIGPPLPGMPAVRHVVCRDGVHTFRFVRVE